MASNIRRFTVGVQIVPSTPTSISLMGELEVDSVTGKLNYSNGSSTSYLVTEQHQQTLLNKVLSDTTVVFGNAADTTKVAKFDLSGATTGKTLTIAAPVTLNRTLTLPDATDTLVGKATTDVLTNKSIDASANTLTNIANSAISTGAAIAYSKLALTGSILNADLAGGIAYSKLVLTGSVLNVDLAGAIAYSKLSLANSIVNADIASAAAINLSKTDKLFDTAPTFTQVATPASPASGKNMIYPKSDGFFYSLDSTGSEKKIGSGAGSINYFSANPDIESGTTGYSVAADGNTFSITIAAPGVVTATAHGMNNGQVVYLTTTGALPTGLATATAYYVVQAATNTFQLSATLGGTGITTTGSQSGVHTFRPVSPITGAVGAIAATATIAASADTSLRGSKNLLLTPGNVGDFALYTITPDPADTAKMLQLSFDYKITTPASYVDGDLQVYLYDVGNAQLIQPAPYKILSSSKQNTFKCVFQTPGSGMTTIRVVIIQANTNSAYGSIRFDNFVCGPQTTSLGAPISDWAAYTPTFSAGFGTVTSINAEWRRVGDTLQMRGTAVAGTVAASAATISLPAGLSHAYTASTTALEGAATTSLTGATQAGLLPLAIPASPTTISFGLNNTNSGFVAVNAGIILANSSSFSWWASLKIVGWSSNVLMSNDSDTRVVVARAYKATNQTSVNPNASYVKIALDTSQYDTHGAVSTSKFTAPVGGYYQVAALIGLAGANVLNNFYLAAVYKNGTLFSAGSAQYPIATGAFSVSFADTIQLNVGDFIELYLYGNGNNSASTLTVIGGNAAQTSTYLSVQRVTGPAAIAATETVACRYTNAAGTTLTKSIANTIPFATKDYDTHGAFVTDTFTCPVSGKYAVKSALVFATGATWASGDYIEIDVLKNGAVHTAVVPTIFFGTFSGPPGGQVSTSITCVAGDTIKISCTPNKTAAGNLPLITTQGYNSVCIERVGN